MGGRGTFAAGNEEEYSEFVRTEIVVNVATHRVILKDMQRVRRSVGRDCWDGMDEGTLSKTKEMLDDMHKRKIDMADEIYVINVGGYIGDNTRSEIEYARETGKNIRYLEESVV